MPHHFLILTLAGVLFGCTSRNRTADNDAGQKPATTTLPAPAAVAKACAGVGADKLKLCSEAIGYRFAPRLGVARAKYSVSDAQRVVAAIAQLEVRQKHVCKVRRSGIVHCV